MNDPEKGRYPHKQDILVVATDHMEPVLNRRRPNLVARSDPPELGLMLITLITLITLPKIGQTLDKLAERVAAAGNHGGNDPAEHRTNRQTTALAEVPSRNAPLIMVPAAQHGSRGR